MKCFKRIRINKQRSNKQLENLQRKKTSSHKEEDYTNNKEKLEEDLENVCDKIAALCGEKNKKLANEYLGKLNDPIEGVNLANTWNLKNKLAPRGRKRGFLIQTKGETEPPIGIKEVLHHLSEPSKSEQPECVIS